MAAPALKDCIDFAWIETLANLFDQNLKVFNKQVFEKRATKGLADLSLMERIDQLTVALQAATADIPPQTVVQSIIDNILPNHNDPLASLYAPRFILKTQFDQPKQALKNLTLVTEYASAEFAIRPFIAAYPTLAFNTLYNWCTSSNEHVRRLASEGSRPRLPWGEKLDNVIENPALTWPILEKLKLDESLYVRKSVANHINDISKDHPQWLLRQIENWNLHNKHQSWIIKHGLRSLIKQGNATALAIFGWFPPQGIEIKAVHISPQMPKLSDTINLEYSIENRSQTPQDLQIDYTLHMSDKNGNQTRKKTFKGTNINLKNNDTTKAKWQFKLVQRSVRKLYKGSYKITIQVNGEQLGQISFMVN